MDLPFLLSRLRRALREDGAFRDVTSAQIPNIHRRQVKARLISRVPGIFCGGFLIKPIFGCLDPLIKVKSFIPDGGRVRSHQTIATIAGRAYAILAGERTFLNLACHLSGVATLTARYVQAIKGSRAQIYDTRKTTLLWRDVEKFAVKCGGGENHRMDLEEAVLVKDNHLGFLKQMRIKPEDVFVARRIRQKRPALKFVEMEANTLNEVEQALRAEAEIVLLDNMPFPRLKKAISLIKSARHRNSGYQPQIEISGSVSLEKAPKLARLGVDRISVGALTHSAATLDLSLEVE